LDDKGDNDNIIGGSPWDWSGGHQQRPSAFSHAETGATKKFHAET